MSSGNASQKPDSIRAGAVPERFDSFVQRISDALADLLREATQDSLTSVTNQSAYLDWASQLDGDLSDWICVFIDINDFKEKNTLYGYSGADTLLRGFGNTLRIVAEKIGARAFRTGGDEFVLFHSAWDRGTEALLESLSSLQRVEVPIEEHLDLSELNDLDLTKPPRVLCASIGVALRDKNEAWLQLKERAERAASQAKLHQDSRNKGCIALWDESMATPLPQHQYRLKCVPCGLAFTVTASQEHSSFVCPACERTL